jgi:hypothetical protein
MFVVFTQVFSPWSFPEGYEQFIFYFLFFLFYGRFFFVFFIFLLGDGGYWKI